MDGLGRRIAPGEMTLAVEEPRPLLRGAGVSTRITHGCPAPLLEPSEAGAARLDQQQPGARGREPGAGAVERGHQVGLDRHELRARGESGADRADEQGVYGARHTRRAGVAGRKAQVPVLAALAVDLGEAKPRERGLLVRLAQI